MTWIPRYLTCIARDSRMCHPECLANLYRATASKRNPRLIHGSSTAATMRGTLVSDRSGADLPCRSDEHLVSARAGLPLRAGRRLSRRSRLSADTGALTVSRSALFGTRDGAPEMLAASTEQVASLSILVVE